MKDLSNNAGVAFLGVQVVNRIPVYSIAGGKPDINSRRTR